MSNDDDLIYHPDFVGRVNKYYALGHDVAKGSRVDIDPNGGAPFWMLILAIPTLPFAILGTPIVFIGCALLGERPKLGRAYLATVAVLLTFLVAALLALGVATISPGLTNWIVGGSLFISGRVLGKRLEMLGGSLARFAYSCALAVAVLAASVGAPLALFLLNSPLREHLLTP